jgi:hypothetical protein
LLSAIGDTFGGQRIGVGMRVANVAARFAVYRELDPEAVAATFYAGALHRLGTVRVVIPRDATARNAQIASWDEPPAGATIVAATSAFPPATADAIRWHREAFDGTGFPDQLRWQGIPETAMTINIARAFVAAGEAQGTDGSPADALFMLVAESGCVFTLSTMREFRMFLATEADAYDAPFEPTWELRADPRALIARVCAEIDTRNVRTAGRGDRLERIIRTILARLPEWAIDPDEAVFAGRLTALARTSQDGSSEDIFTLSRLGLESRAAGARGAADVLLAAGPTFAAFAPTIGAIEEWYDGSGLPDHLVGARIDPLARVLAVAIAADAVTAGDARRRIAAAAGSRLDPAVVKAYLGTERP